MTPPPACPAIAQLHRAEEDADAILRDRVAALLSIEPADVLVGRSCGRCGSSAHGRPWARRRGRRDEVAVSLSRCGEHLMTAVSADGAVGVDLEAVAAVARLGDRSLVLHPNETVPGRMPTAGELAAMWVRKEAILKALGVGLDTPMAEIRVADFDVVDLPAPPGHVAALAVLARRGPEGPPAASERCTVGH